MLNSERNSIILIKEICNDIGIEVKTYSGDWIMQLSYKGKKVFVYGYDFSLNTDSQNQLLKDKSALSEVLSQNYIPCIQNFYFPQPSLYEYMGKSFQDYEKLIKSVLNNSEVVIKPNKGTSGKDVYKTDSFYEAIKIIKEIHTYDDACISKYYKINHEYRVIVLDGNIELIYEKKTNDWIKNLSRGALPHIVDIDSINEKIKKLIASTFSLISARLMAFDIIDIDGKYLILEINGGLMMDNISRLNSIKPKVVDIYKRVIFKIFEQCTNLNT